jgi:hypothetical protein
MESVFSSEEVAALIMAVLQQPAAQTVTCFRIPRMIDQVFAFDGFSL